MKNLKKECKFQQNDKNINRENLLEFKESSISTLRNYRNDNVS